MSATLVCFLDVQSDEKVISQIREIFFESSERKTFNDQAEKDAFYHKYLGYYLERYPELAWIAQNDKVLGYVVVSPQSNDPELLKIQPHLQVFSDELQNYPAHLHINCHVEARGQGIGGELVRRVEERLKAMKIQGLHIMTGSKSANKKFYEKLGFHHQVEKSFHASPILFMSKSL